MILSEMWTALRARIGNPSEVEVPNNVLTRLLNQAQTDMADRYRFHKARKRCTFLTVLGQSRYDLPLDVLEVMHLKDTSNNQKLEKWGDRRLTQAVTPENGKPMSYTRYRNWVELYPPPDADGYVIEVFYKYLIEQLVGTNDTPSLPPTWHMGIVLYAGWYYYDEVDDQPKAATRYASYKTWLQDKPTEIDEESKADMDSGVEVVPLSTGNDPRLDFDHAP